MGKTRHCYSESHADIRRLREGRPRQHRHDRRSPGSLARAEQQEEARAELFFEEEAPYFLFLRMDKSRGSEWPARSIICIAVALPSSVTGSRKH